MIDMNTVGSELKFYIFARLLNKIQKQKKKKNRERIAAMNELDKLMWYANVSM